ncbi:sigma-70 family RNA polymerase sigma factor [Streptococcus mutans]|uniref:sigma-70 family RNA polymerase sigma factor n=1 Tax=Streptococcus mutans TaxID=1309 RepID=UPI0038B89FE7
MVNKVENKRETKLLKASSNGNWKLVDKLLNQHYENLERKDRYYHLSSLNEVISYDNHHIEVENLISDRTPNPFEQLLIKEVNEHLLQSLLSLSDTDSHIILGYVLENKSFLQLSRETGLSNKTVKAHYEKSLAQLKSKLKDII